MRESFVSAAPYIVIGITVLAMVGIAVIVVACCRVAGDYDRTSERIEDIDRPAVDLKERRRWRPEQRP